MNEETMEPVEAGKSAMRGQIHTLGIERAAGMWADAYAGPFNEDEHARLRGAILAAYEAGQLDGAGKAWMDHV